MVKLLFATALLAITTGEALAISRYQTMSMSCDQVHAALRRDGAAILRWQSRRNPGLPLYGKYVSDSRFCELGEVIDFESVPTRDARSCPVYQCIRPDYDRDDRIFRHDR